MSVFNTLRTKIRALGRRPNFSLDFQAYRLHRPGDTVRREHTIIETGEVDSQLGHRGRQPGNEVQWLDKIAWSDFEQPKAGP
jgi:hypothetical protein